MFEIKLSVLCGEGSQACRGWQETIIQPSDHHTVLAWSSSADSNEHTGVSATSLVALIDHFWPLQHRFDNYVQSVFSDELGLGYESATAALGIRDRMGWTKLYPKWIGSSWLLSHQTP